MNITTQEIARVIGVPASRVAALWPLIDVSLADLAKEAWTDYGRIAALATIRVECPPFAPVKERTPAKEGDQYFVRMYFDNVHVRTILGNRSPEDAIRFCGRGVSQLTGRDNYTYIGNLIGVDLLSDPDKLLEINTSAASFAAFFFIHKKVLPAANAMDWIRVRELYNGGHNGLKAFLLLVQMLGQAAGMRDVAESASAQFKKVRDQETGSAQKAGA